MARRKGNSRFKKVQKRVKASKGRKSYMTTVYVLKKKSKKK